MSKVFHKPYSVADESDLVEIPKDLLRDGARVFKTCPAALQFLTRLRESAKSQNVQIVVISSYRSFDRQKELYIDAERRHGKGKGILWVAPPGYSEHHTGYVFDLADRDRPETDDEPSFESTPAFAWLKENALKFGFELSFLPENWQNVSTEPWHWRFVGDETSRKIFHPSVLKRMCVVIQSIVKGLFTF